jgi:hypothetical protein
MGEVGLIFETMRVQVEVRRVLTRCVSHMGKGRHVLTRRVSHMGIGRHALTRHVLYLGQMDKST